MSAQVNWVIGCLGSSEEFPAAILVY
jgi:hypothetical protein